jgi:hypothetical protein
VPRRVRCGAHERYRIGSKFEKVKANIAQFLRINRERNGKTLCQLQTLVTSYSEPQLDDIIAWAKEIGIDIVSLKTFNVSLDAKMTKEQRKNFLHFCPRCRFAETAQMPKRLYVGRLFHNRSSIGTARSVSAASIWIAT